MYKEKRTKDDEKRGTLESKEKRNGKEGDENPKNCTRGTLGYIPTRSPLGFYKTFTHVQ